MWHVWGRRDALDNFGGGNLKEKDHLDDYGVEGRII
jgi:hypothetical protein